MYIVLKVIIFLFLTLPLTLYSQSISGTIYDAQSTVKGAKIFNASKNTIVATNDNGYFEISAKVNDSIIIGSLFHHEQLIILTNEHFDTELVIELKNIVNTLDEVLLENNPEEKPFVEKEYTNSLQEQIEIDKKRNPEKYNTFGSGSLDFVAIAKLIGKLFKKKRIISEPTVIATYKDFATLFKTDAFFNQNLLVNELKVDPKLQTLFFDFCHSQRINAKLLAKNRQLELLEQLYKCSNDFHKIIKEAQKD